MLYGLTFVSHSFLIKNFVRPPSSVQWRDIHILWVSNYSCASKQLPTKNLWLQIFIWVFRMSSLSSAALMRTEVRTPSPQLGVPLSSNCANIFRTNPQTPRQRKTTASICLQGIKTAIQPFGHFHLMMSSFHLELAMCTGRLASPFHTLNPSRIR